MKTLWVLRGVSGSGKTTKANQLAAEIESRESVRYSPRIISADNYFIRPDGLYDFNGRRLKEAHEWCRSQCNEHMANGREYDIILDNTNTQKWEYEPYLKLAEQYGYKVKIEVVGNLTDVEAYAERNKHSVPLDVIKKQASRFEV